MNTMAQQSTQPRISQLVEIISSSGSKLQEILVAQDVPFPSFDEDALSELPKEAADVQDAIIDATSELHDLILDPVSLLFLNGAVSFIIPQSFFLLRLTSWYI